VSAKKRNGTVNSVWPEVATVLCRAATSLIVMPIETPVPARFQAGGDQGQWTGDQMDERPRFDLTWHKLLPVLGVAVFLWFAIFQLLSMVDLSSSAGCP
jgi:hypothetical protein